MPYYAICDDKTGDALSFTSTAPGGLRDGLTAVEVDGPPDGRPWDADRRAYGARTETAGSRIEQAREAWPSDERDVPGWARALAIALGVKD